MTDTGPTSELALEYDHGTGRMMWRTPATRWSWLLGRRIVDQLMIPSTGWGCTIEEFFISPSGQWIVTSRCSGQGEWGYDVIQSHPLDRQGGITEQFGYMLDPPAFSKDESILLGGYGEDWLGGWWRHPDDEHEHPSRGGDLHVGWLFKHCLPSHEISFHELRMTFPVDWLPYDLEAECWLGPRRIQPTPGGFVMELPGGVSFSHSGPLPEVIQLPVPHPDGGRLL